jgi:hypothetical protein
MHGVAVLCISFRLRCADLLRRSNLNGHHISLLFMTQSFRQSLWHTKEVCGFNSQAILVRALGTS